MEQGSDFRLDIKSRVKALEALAASADNNSNRNNTGTSTSTYPSAGINGLNINRSINIENNNLKSDVLSNSNILTKSRLSPPPAPPLPPPRQTKSVPHSPLSSNNITPTIKVADDDLAKTPPAIPPRPRAKTYDTLSLKRSIPIPPPLPPHPNTSQLLLRPQQAGRTLPPRPLPPPRPSSTKPTASNSLSPSLSISNVKNNEVSKTRFVYVEQE